MTRLTVVLPLKDRVPFTLRWLAFAQSVRLPFRVLIADGGSDDAVSRELSDRSRYPALEIEYVRYPPDRSYGDYYAKLADALERVRTPFAALADNDDFPIPSGLGEAVEFLDAHPGFASCGGQCAYFWVAPERTGEVSRHLYGKGVQWKCSRDARSAEDASAVDRLMGSYLNTPDHYDVRRVEDARRIFAAQRDLGLKDLFLSEFLVSFLTAAAGPARRLDSLFIARQHDPVGSCGTAHEQRHGDWFGRMLLPSWSEDFGKFADCAARAVADKDGLPLEEARAGVVRAWRRAAAPAVLQDLSVEDSITPSVALIAPLARRLIGLPPGHPVRRLAKRVFRSSRWLAMDAVSGVEVLAKRVAGADRDFRPVKDFLESPERAP